MLTLITVSMALAFSAPDAELKAETEVPPAQAQNSQSDSKRLSSDEIARVRVGDGVPDYCEIYWSTNPFTGEQQCDYVVCRPWGQPWSIHECSEFRL